MALLKEVTLNGRTYEIYYFTGAVADEKKWSETEVTGSGGGGGGYTVGGTGFTSPGYMNIKSKTKRFDQIILQNKEGKEQSFEFQDWGISCRLGNTLTVLWAIPKGKEWGPYVLVYNHQSGDHYMGNELIKMFLPGRFTLPLLGRNMSWWPLAAIFIVPPVWYAIWGMVAPENFIFGWILLASPFLGFFGMRKVAEIQGRKKAEAYLNGGPDELMRTVEETRSEAPVPAEA